MRKEGTQEREEGGEGDEGDTETELEQQDQDNHFEVHVRVHNYAHTMNVYLYVSLQTGARTVHADISQLDLHPPLSRRIHSSPSAR